MLDNRYVPKVKSRAEIVCYSCNQVGHKSNKCIFDKTLGHVNCRKCQTFDHYQFKCNARDGIKTNLLIDHCVSHNINPKSFSRNKDHDPGYDRFTSEGFIINFDGTRTPIKILRDTGSLQSLITTNGAMACDCLDTSDERLIRGITREVNKFPLVRVNLNSKQVNGL